jgi:hypothetical protein
VLEEARVGRLWSLRQDGPQWYRAGYDVDLMRSMVHYEQVFGGLRMEYEEIAKTFEEWNKSGPLVSVLGPLRFCCLANPSPVRQLFRVDWR